MREGEATYGRETEAAGAPLRRARLYAVWVPVGRERSTAERLTRLMGGAAEGPLFQPTYMGEAKRGGRWVPVERELLQGYVLACTRDPQALAEACARLTCPCRLLCDASGPAPLSPAEAALLGGMGRPGRRALPMSRGYKLPDGRVIVTEGPLRGHEGIISRVDRHKCMAEVELTLAGTSARGRMGLAVMPVPEGDAALSRRLSRRLARLPRGVPRMTRATATEDGDGDDGEHEKDAGDNDGDGTRGGRAGGALRAPSEAPLPHRGAR